MIIYKITNLITNKFYVGQTTRSLEIRWKAHIRESIYQSRYICKSIKKYGPENFKIEEITSANNNQELDKLEKFWIKELDCLSPNGYNLREGGNNTTFSEQTKLKMSLAKKGKPSKKKDFSCSPETAKKIGLANKGNVAWNKGISWSEEHKLRHSEKMKGRKAWNKDLKINNKPIIAINLETLEETLFSSIHEVVSILKVGRCAVQNVLSGRGKRTNNNYTYKYAEGDI